MNATAHSDDPVKLVEQLDADAILARLQKLDRERDALKVLYRAALRARRDEPARRTEGRRDDG